MVIEYDTKKDKRHYRTDGSATSKRGAAHDIVLDGARFTAVGTNGSNIRVELSY